MKKFESIKLLKSILNSNEKRRFNSENNYYWKNNFKTNKCKEHNDFYNRVCLKCNMDICPKCEKNFHRNHQTIKYEEIFPDIIEIQNLQKNIKIYLDNFESLKKEINNWFNELKEKMECFELLFKKNEIINSYGFIMNFSIKNIVCFESIYKFRKLYYNIIDDENNVNNKNKDIFMKINNNYTNEVLPIYLNSIEIKNLLKNLNTKKKNNLIIKYLISLPSDLLNNSSEKYNSINNYKKTVSSISPIEKINSNSLCDKSTGYDNYKTISDIKTNEFKKIINKTIITDFNIENSYENNCKNNNPFIITKKNYSIDDSNNYLNNNMENTYENNTREKNDSNNLNNTFTVGKKNYNISTFNKYLDKMGIINTHSDLHKINSSKNLLNKSSISIKSIKIPNLKNSSSNKNFIYKKQNNILKVTKSAMNSPKPDNINKNDFINNKKWYNNPLLTNKKTQMKTYVHKKFKNIVNNNDLNFTEIKKDNNLIKSNLVIKNSQNVFKNNENLIKQELFKNNNINDINNNIKNELKIDIEQNSMKTVNKTNLLNLIYSPSSNRNNINANKLSKINKLNLFKNNNTNQKIMSNPSKIIKMPKNTPIIINPQKELFLGLELTNSNCKLGFINQKLDEIQLINFSEEDNYSLPFIVSFSDNKKEIKIGKEAENDLMKNPSQTIFNIIKLFTSNPNEIQKEILPYKIYFTKNEENKAYIKINFGPQKDKIIYIEKIISIYFQKLFEKFIQRIKFENEINKANIKIILVIALPNYFTFYHKKLIEEIFKQEVIPKLNNYNKTINFNLEKIFIKNSSNISPLLYIMNNSDKIKNNINNNILIINIDKGSSNISIISPNIENIKEKINFKIKACACMAKGINDILEDFMLYILNNRLDIEIKNYIIKSPFALVKMRNLCEKIKIELLRNNKTKLNLNEILNEYNDKNNKVIEININEYENCFYNYVFNLKQVINKMIENNNLNKSNCIINEIIYIGDIFKDENTKINLEELLKQKNLLSEDILIYNNEYSNKDFYTVGGACYFAINIKYNIFSFQDISQFNLGIKTYNDTLYFITKKGDIIPKRNKETIKIGKNSELELYEEDNKTKEKRLIGKFDIGTNIKYNENKLNYNEITLEYELNEELNLTMKIFNEENISKEINCGFFLYKT